MPRHAVTAADVTAAAASGDATLFVDGDALLTPLARDEASRLGVRLVERRPPTAGAPDGARGVAAAVHVPAGVQLEPFAFDVGRPDMDVRTSDVVTDAHGSPMAAGFMTLREGSFPWSLSYDEVEYVIEGELHIGTPDGTLVGRPGDVLYLPKGMDITFGTPSWARFLYVTYPAQWAGAPEPPVWDRPATFPVRAVHNARCSTCGGEIGTKPAHLTQIDESHFGPKTDPRVALRGKVDSLQALALLVAARARHEQRHELAAHLATVAAYARELLSAEYHGRAVDPISLDGLDEDALHAATHDPQAALGVPHVTPGPDDPELAHWLGSLRCAVREAELLAWAAFAPEASSAERTSIGEGLNRLSSAVYYLQLLLAGDRPEGVRR